MFYLFRASHTYEKQALVESDRLEIRFARASADALLVHRSLLHFISA